MGVTPAGKMGSWSCAMVLPASLAPAFPPRNCPFLVQSIFLASHKLPPHFRMSDFGVVLGIVAGQYNPCLPPFESGRLDEGTYTFSRCAVTTLSHNSVKIIHPPGGSVNPVSGRRRVK